MKSSIAEKLLLDEISQRALNVQKTIRGLSIGELIRLIRNQLGMSQSALAKRAKIPQSTISRVEQGQQNVTLATLEKLFNAMSCEFIIAPILEGSIESIQSKQAKIIAQKRIDYLKGTMNLEKQQPDNKFIEELIKQEEKRLLQGSKTKLWENR